MTPPVSGTTVNRSELKLQIAGCVHNGTLNPIPSKPQTKTFLFHVRGLKTDVFIFHQQTWSYWAHALVEHLLDVRFYFVSSSLDTWHMGCIIRLLYSNKTL